MAKSPQETASEPTSGALSTTLALRDLAFAVQALQLYPPGSPVVLEAVGRAYDKLKPLVHAGRLSLAILPETIHVRGEDVGTGSRTVRSLAERLHQRGVSHLHLDTSLQTKDLQILAELLATSPDELKADGGIKALCQRQHLEGMQLEMLQLEKLYEEDEEVAGDPDASIWEQILGGYSEEVNLQGIDWESLADDREQLADFLGWLLDDESPPPGITEMSRVQLVRAVCVQVGSAAAELGPDRIEAVTEVFSRFYDKLDKEVWIDLLGQPLRVGPGADATTPASPDLDGEERAIRAAATELGATDLAAGIAATLSRQQVEDLLVYALTSREEESPRIFGLFQNLLEERSERDLMEQAIRDAVEEQTKGDGERKTFEELWPHLNDALKGENLDDYVSTTYRAQLDQLLAERPLTSLWDTDRIAARMGELNPLYLMRRKAKVMLDVLKNESDDDDYAALVLELERGLPDLIVDGQFIAAEEILKAMATDLVPSRGRTDIQREAARDVLIRFCNQHTLRELVRNLAGKRRTQIDAATRIFSSLGPMAVPALLEALSQERSRAIRVHLVGMLAAIGDQALPEIRKQLRDKRWFFVRNLVWIIGEIGDARFVPHLGIIANHPDVRVRRETIRSTGKLQHEAAIQVLLSAIEDDDLEVQLLAIRGLGRPGAHGAVDRLRELLRLPNLTGNNTDVIRAAAIALGRIGSPAAAPELKKLTHRPLLFRRRRIQAREAAVWAVATLRGEVTGDAPEARLSERQDDEEERGDDKDAT